MTHNQFHQTLRLIADGITEPALVADAWQHWQALDPEERLHILAGNGRDGERVRLWSLAWDGGTESILYHVEELERQIRALETHLANFAAALTGAADPTLWRIAYLDQLLQHYDQEHDFDHDPDPDATREALALIGETVHDLRHALAGVAVGTDVEVPCHE